MIEELILANLINNEEFTRKVLPYIHTEYFQDRKYKITFDILNEYINKFNALPTKEALFIELDKLEKITEQDFKECQELIPTLKSDKNTKLEWLIENTEKFCQDKAIYNAIHQSILILDDKTGKLSKGAIPQLLSDALAVSFDSHIGHDYFEDLDARYEYYHEKQTRLPFDVDILNKVTNGGIPNKTLNIIVGGINVGKTLTLCHFASAYLMDCKNVLYITMEIAEEEIARRIDANLLDVPIADIEIVPEDAFKNKITTIRSKGNGKLVIKQYPDASASAQTFKHLLNELKIKKNFIPDVILIDYLNICASFRIKNRADLYQYMKSVAEELRGLAVEMSVPIWTAIQLNRGGMTSSDPDMDDSADSIGIPATADFMLAIVSNEELEENNQYMCKQLKSRYRDKSLNRRFIIGVDKNKMRLYDDENANEEEQKNEPESNPEFNFNVKRDFSDFI